MAFENIICFYFLSCKASKTCFVHLSQRKKNIRKNNVLEGVEMLGGKRANGGVLPAVRARRVRLED